MVEGVGHTVVNGERHDWSAGDLLMLPMLPGGVEHQHFNAVEGQECHWIAFIWLPFWDALLSTMELTEDHPDWKSSGRPSAVGLQAPR